MRRALLLCAMVLLLGACEANAEINVANDGSGTFGFSLLVEKQYLPFLKAFGQGDDPFAAIKDQLKDSPVAFTVNEEDINGGKSIRALAPFKSVEELKSLAASGGSSGPLGDGLKGIALEKRGDGWHFEAQAPPANVGGLSGVGDQAPPITIAFRVTLPGDKKTTTADATERHAGKTTFIWRTDVKNPKAVNLVATTTAASSTFPVVPVAAAGAGLAVAAALTAAAASKKRARLAQAQTGPETAAPQSDPPVAP